MSYQTNLKCLCCDTSNQRTWHHLKSQKAYPEFKNNSWNLMPLCLSHHNLIHSKGLNYMAENFPIIRHWLLSYGWEFDENINKWIHIKEARP